MKDHADPSIALHYAFISSSKHTYVSATQWHIIAYVDGNTSIFKGKKSRGNKLHLLIPYLCRQPISATIFFF